MVSLRLWSNYLQNFIDIVIIFMLKIKPILNWYFPNSHYCNIRSLFNPEHHPHVVTLHILLTKSKIVLPSWISFEALWMWKGELQSCIKLWMYCKIMKPNSRWEQIILILKYGPWYWRRYVNIWSLWTQGGLTTCNLMC